MLCQCAEKKCRPHLKKIIASEVEPTRETKSKNQIQKQKVEKKVLEKNGLGWIKKYGKKTGLAHNYNYNNNNGYF